MLNGSLHLDVGRRRGDVARRRIETTRIRQVDNLFWQWSPTSADVDTTSADVGPCIPTWAVQAGSGTGRHAGHVALDHPRAGTCAGTRARHVPDTYETGRETGGNWETGRETGQETGKETARKLVETDKYCTLRYPNAKGVASSRACVLA